MQEAPSFQQYSIQHIVTETPDAKTFVLHPVSGVPYIYKAGQFLTFSFEKIYGEERRSYSISSSPALNEPLSITIKRVENGEFSRYFIDHARVGDILTCTGVAGLFIVPDDIADYEQVFFLVAGSGITPCFSLIKTLLATQSHISIVLIYSSRSAADTIFYNQLINLSEKNPGRLKIDFLFSSSNNLLKARLNNSLLTSMLYQHSKTKFENILCYVCGPVDYMDTVSITLLTEGVPAVNIRKENFSTYKPEIEATPPDTSAHYVSIHTREGIKKIKVQYPVSILQQAKEENIHLPYSCQSGQCGSCMARCVRGKIWMAYNEVLTERDITEGYILTCQGFPVDGDAEITY